MVSGNPYISVKSATRNAENAPNDRQSREVFGFVKLNAKMMKMSELRMTSHQRPYESSIASINDSAYVCVLYVRLLPAPCSSRQAGLFPVVLQRRRFYLPY